MFRRSFVALAFGRQPMYAKVSITEKQVDSLINMDRIYRNLAMEKREYKRPWTFEKDMRGSVIHVNYQDPAKPFQSVGTVLDVSHNETSLDAWARIMVRRGKVLTWYHLPLMNPMMDYKIVRDRDEVKIWENYVKEMGQQRIIYRFGKNKRSRTTDHAMYWS
eukprot:TRINITY_DN13097_c0_g1_i2.p2 TRINITY_DN13097_c0_g1~~TRINITY_DN13097_c0_g1_i2.p2  ORF type:complete len:162 (+),score=6.74 TRINITY_DN13097_c0_g1_i2:100-585(+)